MKRTLFEISEDIQALDDLLFEMGGDVTDADAVIDKWFTDNADALNAKLDGYAALIAQRRAFAITRRAAADALEALAKADENTAQRLKDRLKFFFESRGIDKMETSEHRFALAKNGGKLPLLVTGEVPTQFQKTTVSPDSDAIRAALDSGEKLDFAELGTAGSHLRIR